MELSKEFEGYELKWMVKAIIHTDIDFNDFPEKTIELVKYSVSLPFFREFKSHVYGFKRPGKYGDRFLKRMYKDLISNDFESVIIADCDHINDTDNRLNIFMNPYYCEKDIDNSAKSIIELLIPLNEGLLNTRIIYEWFKHVSNDWNGIYGYVTLYVDGLYPDDFFKKTIQTYPIDCLNASYYESFCKQGIKDLFWLNLVSKHHKHILPIEEIRDNYVENENGAILFESLSSLSPDSWDQQKIYRNRCKVDGHIIRHVTEEYEWSKKG